MASAAECHEIQELEDPPAAFKSAVWESFAFPVDYNSDGVRVVDRTKTVGRLWRQLWGTPVETPLTC